MVMAIRWWLDVRGYQLVAMIVGDLSPSFHSHVRFVPSSALPTAFSSAIDIKLNYSMLSAKPSSYKHHHYHHTVTITITIPSPSHHHHRTTRSASPSTSTSITTPLPSQSARYLVKSFVQSYGDSSVLVWVLHIKCNAVHHQCHANVFVSFGSDALCFITIAHLATWWWGMIWQC